MSQFMNSNNIPSFKLVSYKEKPDTYRAKPYKTKQQKNTQSEDNTDIELFNIGYKYGHCDTPNENGIGLYYERSMVFMVSPESPDGKLIAYSPSKTHKNDTFRESVEYNSQTNSGYIDNIVIEELVEGTMVYLFYIPNVGWECQHEATSEQVTNSSPTTLLLDSKTQKILIIQGPIHFARCLWMPGVTKIHSTHLMNSNAATRMYSCYSTHKTALLLKSRLLQSC